LQPCTGADLEESRMKTTRTKFAALAIAVAGLAAVAAPAGANNVAWSVSVGGPGFAVNAGQPAFGPGFRPGFRPVVVRPYGFRPVVVARPAWVARPVFVSAPPVYFAPRPIHAPRVVVVPRPYVGVTSFPSNRWYN
jgi:hypothetical protein